MFFPESVTIATLRASRAHRIPRERRE